MTAGPEKLVLYRRIRPGQIDADAQARAISRLPAPLQERLARRRDPFDRLRSLAGLALLAEGMAALGQRDFSLQRLTLSSHGKPDWPGPIRFSISHANELVACAFDTEPVGLDVEWRRPLPRIPETGLTPAEREAIAEAPERFFDFWTAREAVLKAAGDAGITRLTAVQLMDDTAEYADTRWHLFRAEPLSGYVLCLASRDPRPPVLREAAGIIPGS